MSKKRDDLEAIVDLLHEWCVEYGEDYARIHTLDGVGHGSVDPMRPDYWDMNITKDYGMSEDTTNEAQ